VGGAARGAAGGAIIGAIAGDAGRGAAIGSAVGLLAGWHRRRAEEIAAANQQLQTQQQIEAQSPNNWRCPGKSWLTTTLPLRPACKAGATHN
jgi:hypothetical protein